MAREELRGTRTLQNLMNAFAGESQARSRYTMYAAVAAKEGYVQIEHIFLETAENERVHAKEFYKYILQALEENEYAHLPVTGDYPVAMGNTYNNLISAAAGEHEEFAVLYSSFADIADEEHFHDIAKRFRAIASVEDHHERRFRKLAENIKEGKVFERPEEVEWKCLKCGYIHTGKSAPAKCPSCMHPQSYFELHVVNY